MATVADNRRRNIAALKIEAGGSWALLSERTGISPVMLSQWATGSKDSKTKKPRGMWPASCRQIERGMGKDEGWLDASHDDEAEIGARIRALTNAALELAERFDALPDRFVAGKTKIEVLNRLLGEIRRWSQMGETAAEPSVEPSPEPPLVRKTQRGKAHAP